MPRGLCYESGTVLYPSSQCLFAKVCVLGVGDVGEVACQTGSRRVENVDFPSKSRRAVELNK